MDRGVWRWGLWLLDGLAREAMLFAAVGLLVGAWTIC